MVSIIKKREIARSIIKDFDDASGGKWTNNDEAMVEAFLRFNDIVSDNTDHDVIPADDTAVIKLVDDIVQRFYTGSKDYFKPQSQYFKGEIELVDNEVGELRAKLSSYLYTLSRRYFKKLSLSRGAAKARCEQAEAISYKKLFDEQVKAGKSDSFSDSYARKMYKADENYLSVLQETDEIEQEYWEAINVFERARDVLNAMSKNKNN